MEYIHSSPDRDSGTSGVTKTNRNQRQGDSFRFDAFISYSRSGENELAHSLQVALEGFSCRLFQLRAMRVFRDEANIDANPDLWGTIKNALDRSRFLILLASPKAKASKWVHLEVEHFVKQHGASCVCIALADGVTPWTQKEPKEPLEDVLNRPDCAIAPKIYDIIRLPNTEPKVVDLSRFTSLPRRSLQRAPNEFLDQVAAIAARILGREKDELYGVHIIRQRRVRLITKLGMITLLALTVFAVVTALFAFKKRNEAVENEKKAKHNLALSTIEAARFESQADHPIAAAARAREALNIEDSPATRLEAWETLSALVMEDRVQFVGSPVGIGLAVLPDGGIATTVKEEIVVVDSTGIRERWPHNVGWGFGLVAPLGSGRLYALGMEGRLQGWDLATKKLVLDIQHQGQCYSLDSTPSGGRLITGCSDGKVSIYEPSASSTVAEPVSVIDLGRTGETWAVISPDGNRIFSLCNGLLAAHEVNTGKQIWSRTLPANGRIALSPDGSLLSWYLTDGRIEVASASTGMSSRNMHLDGVVYQSAFSPDGSRLAVAAKTETRGSQPGIIEWELATGRKSLNYEAVDIGIPVSVAYRDLDKIVMSTSAGVLYEISRSRLKEVQPRGSLVRDILTVQGSELLPVFRCGNQVFQDPRLAVGSMAIKTMNVPFDTWCRRDKNGYIEVFQRSGADKAWRIPVQGVSASSAWDGKSILIGTTQGEITAVDLRQDAIPRTLGKLPGRIDFLRARAPDLVIADVDEDAGTSAGIYRVQPKGLVPLLKINPRDLGAGKITAAEFSPDKKIALVAVHTLIDTSTPTNLIIIDLAKYAVKATIPIEGGIVRSILILDNGARWALGTAGGAVVILESTDWKPSGLIKASTSPIFSLALLPGKESQEQMIAAGDANGRIALFDLHTHQKVFDTLPLAEPVTALLPGALGSDWWLGIGTRVERWKRFGGADDLRAITGDVRIEYPKQILARAVLAKSRGDTAGAIALYGKLVRLVPGDQNYLNEYVNLLEEAGQLRKALKVWSRIDEIWDAGSEDVGADATEWHKTLVQVSKARILQALWEKEGKKEDLQEAAGLGLGAIIKKPLNRAYHAQFIILLAAAGYFDPARNAALTLYELKPDLKDNTLTRRNFAVLAAYTSLLGGLDMSEPRQKLLEGWSKNKDTKPIEDVFQKMLLGENISGLETSTINDPITRAKARLLLGFQALRFHNRNEARKQFELGIKDGDFLRFNHNALLSMDSGLVPVPISEKILSQYVAVLDYVKAELEISVGHAGEGISLLHKSVSTLGEDATAGMHFEVCRRLILSGQLCAQAAEECMAAARKDLGQNQPYTILLAALLPGLEVGIEGTRPRRAVKPPVDEDILNLSNKWLASNTNKWPAPILKALVLQEINDKALIEEAGANSKEAKGHLCEAHFYLGLKDLASGLTAEGDRYLQETIDAQMTQYIETEFARVLISNHRLL